MVKKIGYKTPSIIALTIAGTAISAHHADAAENTTQQAPEKVIDSENALQQAEQAKSATTSQQATISGTQSYQDPTQVTTNETTTPTQANDTTSTSDVSSTTTNTTEDSHINLHNEAQVSPEAYHQSTVNEASASNDASTETLSNNTSKIQPNTDASVNTEATSNNTTAETLSNNTTDVPTNTDASLKTEATSDDTAAETLSNNTSEIQPNTDASANTEVTSNDTTAETLSNNTTDVPTNTDASLKTEATSNTDTTKTQTQPEQASVAPSSAETSKQSQLSSENNTNSNPSLTAKQNTYATQSNDTDINANPDGPTPPRVGGKGGPATLSLNSSNTGTTAFRSAGTTALRATAPAAYKPQVSSQINDYIRKQNYTVPTYEEDFSSYFPKYGYRNGVGRPEGIVVHDTANPNSTIDGEISYMKRNYQSAFVHGFISDQRIIETQPTDYLSWGAGPNANERFINIELVHVYGYDNFARQMNNFADYAATNLQYYNLRPDSAEYDGQGTVWTHDAVSRFLGGTDHSDPHGYLQSRGYSYNELYDLINEKYMVKMGLASPAYSTGGTTTPSTPSTPSTTPSSPLTVNKDTGVGRIKTTNSGLYTTVYDQAGKKTSATNQTLNVTKKASLNGNNFYLVSDYNTGSNLGWVKQSDVDYRTSQPAKTINQSYTIPAGTVLYSVPWGTNAQVAGKVSGTGAQNFKATQQKQIANSVYIYGTANNLSGWVNQSVLKAPTNQLKVTADTGVGRIKTTNNGLYASVYDANGKKTSATNQTLNVTKKASLNGDQFYLVTDYNKGTNLGWVKQSDVEYRTSQPAIKISKNFTIPAGTKLYTVPWGTSAQVAGAVSGTGAQNFKATQQKQIANAVYIYGTANNLSGWVNQTLLSAPKATQQVAQAVSQIGQLKPTTSGMRATIYDSTAKDAKQYANRTYKVTKTASANNQNFVLLQSANNTPLGWFKAEDVNTRALGKEVPTSGQYTVNATTSGLYAIPWGTSNQRIDTLKNLSNRTFNATKSVLVGKDTYLFGNVNQKMGWINKNDLAAKAVTQLKAAPTQIKTLTKPEYYVVYNRNGQYYTNAGDTNAKGNLSSYYESIFKVQRSAIINGVTWYYGQFNDGTRAWIKSSDLRTQLTRYFNSPYTFNQAVDTQMNLSYKPQVQHVAGQWVDASRTEVANAMNPSLIEKDPTQKYQFLKLDKYQGLDAAQLDKLLVGKGILAGQGAAFKEAAQMNNINEIYLISHALLETGNGTSTLANGGYVDANNKVVTNAPRKFYNMFGIGAVDTDAIRGGFKTAEAYGWNTVSKAIIGGASFIKDRYIGIGQNTLYRMRWNPNNPGTHQYATDINWAHHNAARMKQFYDQIAAVGKFFDVDHYKK
ncbi:SH3-like domain-containing protein [Staphylococcus chromogenes]|uniref:Bifunctional autolysin n=2 Tax=Staphylococcus chromogenes TaxID=46126 RepID=A0AAE5SZK4_STACR|nr:GW dipeptide domain-containing protein [Staphylococcus chromogenes]MBP0045252.1 SH3-like domain-containing protein [Staphylococcus chromogenes]MCD9070504.1 GW dipeptide domain-containing protein [Staphylococcus chromogenes]MCE5092553.1 SH3-like domain-containing protein [Staphylococcus chromogenes]MDQ7175202.1 GW dipeptide domain-containing protein [Staphylococcus chromogenes]MDT0654963.1 GW dipeptide domain-containing protein [Staphylococcus chromogenes]